MSQEQHIEEAYRLAKERYAALGVDTDQAIKKLAQIPVSIHCWQGDDVTGFEQTGSELDGGIAATGNYPGKARNAEELRGDLDQALSAIPGTHRVNVHSIYAETAGVAVDRTALLPSHFEGWMAWAKERNMGMDFNPTFFAHENASDGFTLAHREAGIRRFWIEHGIACRKIGEAIGKELGTPCITNFWMPDGYKDAPADRAAPRARLRDSLDAIFEESVDPQYNKDSVECKLFGIGSESYVAGSHEFYMGYALKRGTLLTLDTGHFHPTEVVSDKLSSVLLFIDEVLLHVSRGVRWDSDHIVVLSDETREIAKEIIRGDYTDRVHIGLDFFDASVNRIAAWVIGTRAMIRALMQALLEPIDKLREFEKEGDFTGRLALLEEAKALPSSAVWDYYCLQQNVPVGMEWLDNVKLYEKQTLSKRG